MAEMISVREAAERWKITERRVSTPVQGRKNRRSGKAGETLDDSGGYAEAGGSANPDRCLPENRTCIQTSLADRRLQLPTGIIRILLPLTRL